MIFVSVAEATRHLGIDAKTLHRWVQDAQISLQCHPHDGRKKGISEHQMQTLARLHHRSQASLSPEAPVPIPNHALPLPDVLLALPETLAALHAQIAALHQQVADLTVLLQRPVPPTPAPPSSTPTRPPPPPSPDPRVRPVAAKVPVHVIARVEYQSEGCYVIVCPKRGLLPIRPDTEEWFAWVKEQESFRFVGKGGFFTAHHWWRVPHGAWRAHRTIRNHTHNVRLAPNQEVTIAVLEQAAEALQAHLT